MIPFGPALGTGARVVYVMASGKGNCVMASDIPVQGRNGRGREFTRKAKSDWVAAACASDGTGHIAIGTSRNFLKFDVQDVRSANVFGADLIEVGEGDQVVDAFVPPSEEE
jgi:hypothetical protein